ncbi:hypothetical protein C8Q80DRAFT_1212718 [Daedaleopsis nitida]|nr:hypothetical protein C8Q80DRAFT_1212718 [Daedaleopsis nitida]
MSETKTSCTCEQCYEGWLSPRMRQRLQDSSHIQYWLSQDLLNTHDGVPKDVTSVLPIDYAHIGSAVHYLPAEVRAKIGPSALSKASPAGDEVYRGYVAVLKAITEFVSPESEGADTHNKGFPTVSVLSAHLSALRDADAPDPDADPDSPSNAELIAVFLDNGGKAEHALDCIVDRAREELSPLGHRYTKEDEYIDRVLYCEENLPECKNDDEFDLVRIRLGLPRETLGVVPEGEVDSRDPVSDDEE